MTTKTPQVKTLLLQLKGHPFNIEYFIREGSQETILFVHGLGGAKENFWEACITSALAEHTLICFDNPGTGNSTYYDDLLLNVEDLADMMALFITHLGLHDFILAGTSMGGLTTLLYLQRYGTSKVKAYINIEGNLMPEDCMFSSKVVQYPYEVFAATVYPDTIVEMKQKGNPGYHIIANNLELNTNIKAYYHYSFQTVSFSETGELLQQYLKLPLPRIFIYGDQNEHLSYLPKLRLAGMNVKKVSDSNHFVFYDNPKELYDVISQFN